MLTLQDATALSPVLLIPGQQHLFTALFGIVFHLWLKKWVFKFLYHLNTFSGFQLYLGALPTKFSSLFSILASDLLISAYVLRFALPAVTNSLIYLLTLLQHCLHSCKWDYGFPVLFSHVCTNDLLFFFTVYKLFQQCSCFCIPNPGLQLHLLHLLHYDFK